MRDLHSRLGAQIEAVEHELVSVLAMARQMVEATVRNPLQKFTNHVRFVNYGRCYFFRPFSVADLDRLDVHKACSHFTQAFHNPAEFTLCFTGVHLHPLVRRRGVSSHCAGQRSFGT